MLQKSDFVGIDLFAGAGGLSLGAKMSGIDVKLAIEKDFYAGATYAANHENTELIVDDISRINEIKIKATTNQQIILFGGPPCQGFSYSNQKTRKKENPSNWLLDEFVRLLRIILPDWVVFENVCGFVNTEEKWFFNRLITYFNDLGYTCTWKILNAQDFGVPQKRSRFFLIGSKSGRYVNFPDSKNIKKVTVEDAIQDLPELPNGASVDVKPYKMAPQNRYAISLRKTLELCTGNLVTKNASHIIDRYKYVPPGGNWSSIPERLMSNYEDRTRCHTGIYHRLNSTEPAITIGNYRKAMLIHPWENRGLSVREAARIQSFPDNYVFKGSIGFQQQQVGNAVPPLLAKAVFDIITGGGNFE